MCPFCLTTLCIAGSGVLERRPDGALGESFKIRDARPRVIGDVDRGNHFCVRLRATFSSCVS